MPDTVVPTPRPPTVEVAGSGAVFPVRRILCVGQNYASHTREMGGDPDRTPPFFFGKPADAVVADGAVIPYPSLTGELHHEVELVIAIGTGGSDIAVADALGHVFGYAVGIDLTRRDLQRAAKAAGQPWDWAKGFDRSAPVGAIRRAAEIGHPAAGRITLEVNGERRQDGDLADMIRDTAQIVSIASTASALEPGDLIFTGTPSGVGAIGRGDRVVATIDGVGRLAIEIAAD